MADVFLFSLSSGVLALSLPNLVALNLDWTCVTDAITKDLLLGSGETDISYSMGIVSLTVVL